MGSSADCQVGQAAEQLSHPAPVQSFHVSSSASMRDTWGPSNLWRQGLQYYH